MSEKEIRKIAWAYRYFLQEIKKGSSEDIAHAVSRIRGLKAREACIALIRDEIHEKEAEIAALKNGLNWLDSYSL